MVMSSVCFRFYEELNDYLPEAKGKVWFEYAFTGAVSLREVFQSMLIPDNEIDLILVNRQSQGLDYLLHDGDRISVYPVFESFDLSGISRVREKPLRDPRFVCDVHLGRLCKYLRMLGFDTLYSNRYTPDEMIDIARREKRIILSRSYGLTRHQEVTRAHWIWSPDPLEQIKDLIHKLDLSSLADPLTRCLNCNHKIVRVEKQEILHRLHPGTAKFFKDFFICPPCDQIYWEGSHFENMSDFIRHSILVE